MNLSARLTARVGLLAAMVGGFGLLSSPGPGVSYLALAGHLGAAGSGGAQLPPASSTEPAPAEPVVSGVAEAVPGGSATPSVRVGDPAAATPAPAAPQVKLVAPGKAAVRVPILMYHYIRVNPQPWDRLGYDLSVTPADFEAQMDWLDRSGFNPVTLEELRAYLSGRGELPDRPVVLTFDDGYADLYTNALPVLRKHGFRAVSYVVTGFLDSPGYLTRQQVLELQQAGVEIGSHTLDHVDLTRTPHDRLLEELAGSKAELEKLVGRPVLDFCYPAGRFNGQVVRMVAQAGYQSATTTQPGEVHSLADRMTWTRVRIRGGESLEVFARQIDAEAGTESPSGSGSNLVSRWRSQPTPAPVPVPPPRPRL